MNDDLIRRSDAIKAMAKAIGRILYDAEAVSQHVMNSIPAVAPKQEWLPCSERLPESQGYYICTCKDGSICRRTTTIKWSNGWQLSGRRAFWTVVAWMPLPEPWKGADDDTD